MPESCYFYVDTSTHPNEQTVKPLCLECYDTIKVGSYWDGSLGYGPFDFVCYQCGKVIYKGSPEIDEETTPSS